MGLTDLPNPKWVATGKQAILKEDFKIIEDAILESGGVVSGQPPLVWVDVATIRVEATADCPASALFNGIPNILNPATWVSGGLSDSKVRGVTSNVSMIMTAGGIWGSEKASQLYALFALAADADTTFVLKSMPFMRVKSQASQTISLGTMTTPGTGIGYGLTTDEMVGGKVYILSGASRGLMRTISANNNDNSTGGTVTYSGGALSLSAGDLFIILPPGVNFLYLGCFFNNSGGDIVNAGSSPNHASFTAAGTYFWVVLATSILGIGVGGGGGGGGGNGSSAGGDGKGGNVYIQRPNIVPGALLTIIVGAGGLRGEYNTDGHLGGTTSLNGVSLGTGGPGGLVGGTPGGPTTPTIPLNYSFGYGGAGGGSSNPGVVGDVGCLFLSW